MHMSQRGAGGVGQAGAPQVPDAPANGQDSSNLGKAKCARSPSPVLVESSSSSPLSIPPQRHGDGRPRVLERCRGQGELRVPFLPQATLALASYMAVHRSWAQVRVSFFLSSSFATSLYSGLPPGTKNARVVWKWTSCTSPACSLKRSRMEADNRGRGPHDGRRRTGIGAPPAGW
ncbi:hypothetical protein PVAP13_J008501 [Panicum virgatum]|nr:hypothetical protein PVAP13_J008501 [Panicum virgatum]